MNRKLTACLIAFLILSVFGVPVSAGGWAVITLEGWPASSTVGQAVTVQFSIRQHGIRLLEGIDPSVNLRNALNNESLRIDALPVSGKPGFYEATWSFPSGGEWEWSIQAFGMDQRMPDLEVQAEAGAPISKPSSEPDRIPSTPVSAGIAGLLLVGGLAAVLLRRQVRWAFAAILLGFLVGGAGLVWAAFQNDHRASLLETVSNLPSTPISGADLFVAKGCISCHTNHKVDSQYVGFNAEIGPDLTDFSTSPEYLRMWLKDPASVRANAEMPNLGLDEAEIDALIAFLEDPESTSEKLQPGKQKIEIPLTATLNPPK